MYAKFNVDGVRQIYVRNAEENKRFQGNLWSIGIRHNQEAEWQKDTKNELVNNKHRQERVVISVEKLMKQCREMPIWNVPGKDGVQGYQVKNFSNLYEQIAAQINKTLMGDGSLPAWMTHGRTILCEKNSGKSNAV